MYKNHTKCRGCGSTELEPVFDLGVQALANDFVTTQEEQAGMAPLKVLLCRECTLAQLSVVVDPVVLYRHYNYVTSHGPTMLAHFKKLVGDLDNWKGGVAGKNVMEIGSNDGTLLQFCKQAGALRPLGIDPAENLSQIARESGIHTITGFFDEQIAETVREMFWQPDVIIARHVFAHVDDWHGFMRALTRVSYKDTVVAIEVPYVDAQIRACSFDQIYHEHLSYVGIASMMVFLNQTDWRLCCPQFYDIHGGSVLFILGRKDSDAVARDGNDLMMCSERTDTTRDNWHGFAHEAETRIVALRNQVDRLRFEGKTVCAYGASAKSSVWIQAGGFRKEQIAFICDNTPQKQGKLSPGTDIPIVPECNLTDKADAVICSAWNFVEEIRAKNPEFKGRWINPLDGYKTEPEEKA